MRAGGVSRGEYPGYGTLLDRLYIGKGNAMLPMFWGLYINQLARTQPMQRIQNEESIPPTSSTTFANPSTALWLVKIIPPYFLSDPGFNSPDSKSSLTVSRLVLLNWCSRTGMKAGL